MIWSKLIQKLDFAMSMMSLFSPSNVSKFITHTIIPLERSFKSRLVIHNENQTQGSC